MNTKSGFILYFCGFLAFLAGICVWYFLANRPIIITSQTPTWRGITLGISTRQDVITTLGQPQVITRCPSVSRVSSSSVQYALTCIFGQEVYQYQDISPPGLPIRTHEMYFKSGLTWLIVENKMTFPQETAMSVDTLIAQQGLPEKVIWSQRSPHYRALLYCQKGIIAHANPTQVRWILYSLPMPLQECLRFHQGEISENNPFPDSDVVGPEDFWGYSINDK